MTFVAALLLLCIAVALIAAVALLSILSRRPAAGYDPSAKGTQPVESELLRRPLRSRYSA